MAEIALQGVTKRFGEVTAVRELDLVVRDGEFVTLVGPSGCGKSTVLNLLAGLEQVTSGAILINGQDMTRLPPRDRDLAMVFQSYALYPHMTVEQNLGFALKMQGVKREIIDRKTREVARLLDIEPLLARKPRQLSGGQRQRVAVGRAVIREPRAFLLDEPLSNLDARLRLYMRAELKLLFNRLNATVIYVTHDQAEAMTMSDRILVLSQGVAQQVGTPREIYTQPTNAFVAEFMGNLGINMISCRLEASGTDLVLVTERQRFPLTGDGPVSMLRRWGGEELQLGMRPEDVSVSLQPDGPVALECRTQIVEEMGNESVLYGEYAGKVLSAILPEGQTARPGQPIYMRITLAKAHFFDARTSQRVPGA